MAAPDGAVVITAGAEPTIVAARETAPDLISVPPVPQAEVVDTNSCGDAFVGGFLRRAALGCELRECVEEGHRCAGIVLRRRGCSIEAAAM